LHHPGIVTVYDFGQTSEGHLYFVMEYVDGADLRRVLQTTRLEPDQALELVCQVCEALQAAHKLGIIHRDIKPANILLASDGMAKLADFGLCRPVGEINTAGLSNSDIAMGTLDYMSPEQRSGHSDHRTDIFSLGITLYEMLTGRPPRGAFDPPSRKVRIDVRLDEVVLKALQEEPDRRYQQASEMKMDVDRIRTSTAAPVMTPAPALVAKPAPRRPLEPVAVVMLLILGGTGFFAWKKYSPQTASAAPATANAQVLDWSPTQQTPAILQAANPAQTPAPAPATAAKSGDGVYPFEPGITVTTLAGTVGKAGYADGAASSALFNRPDGVAVDSSGNIYVTERDNNRLRKITPEGMVTTLAGSNLTGGNDGAGSAATFALLSGVALDSKGNAYAVSSSTLRKITPAGVVTTLVGDTGKGGGHEDGIGRNAQLGARNKGVAVDGSGNIYVADYENSTIRKITPEGVVTTLAGLAGMAGNSDGTGSAARFDKPNGLAVDGSGNVYVADFNNNAIRKITPNGAVTTLGVSFKAPYSVVVDRRGSIYVGSIHAVYKITPGGLVTTLAGKPYAAGAADGIGSEARFVGGGGLALDSEGNIYFADLYNNTIRKITPSVGK